MSRKIVNRILITGSLVCLVCLLSGVIWSAVGNRLTQRDFQKMWAVNFRHCTTLQQVKALPIHSQVGHLFTRQFADGSWVAIDWHCIHDEDGEWDGSVLKDSTGKLYWTEYHFCGEEGFESEFASVPASSLKQFYNRVKFKLTSI